MVKEIFLKMKFFKLVTNIRNGKFRNISMNTIKVYVDDINEYKFVVLALWDVDDQVSVGISNIATNLSLSSTTGSSAAKAAELIHITTMIKKSKYLKFTTQCAPRLIL